MGTRASTTILISPTAAIDLQADWISNAAAEVTSDHRGVMIEFEANFRPTWCRFDSDGTHVDDLLLEIQMLRWLGQVSRAEFLFIREGEIEDIAGLWDAESFGDVPAVQAYRKWIQAQSGAAS